MAIHSMANKNNLVALVFENARKTKSKADFNRLAPGCSRVAARENFFARDLPAFRRDHAVVQVIRQIEVALPKDLYARFKGWAMAAIALNEQLATLAKMRIGDNFSELFCPNTPHALGDGYRREMSECKRFAGELTKWKKTAL